jgi:hypothetical protein
MAAGGTAKTPQKKKEFLSLKVTIKLLEASGNIAPPLRSHVLLDVPNSQKPVLFAVTAVTACGLD